MKGKLIVIEGTDCSGKETQSNLLVKALNQNGYKTEKFCFPNYNSPTGKIIAGPYLGKEDYGKGYFKEGASNVNPYVSSLYFAADRKYNIEKILSKLKDGINVVVDRYIDSNLAHQGAKLKEQKEKRKIFKFLENLEYKLLKLPKPDITIFLYMPLKCAKILKQRRNEKPDQHEQDEMYLKNAEKTYLLLYKKHKYIKINCSKNLNPKSIEEISKEIYLKVKSKINNKKAQKT